MKASEVGMQICERGSQPGVPETLAATLLRDFHPDWCGRAAFPARPVGKGYGWEKMM